MSTVTQFRNCSPLCAEMLGGNCQGHDCPYAPNSEIPWSEFDHRIVDHRRAERHAQRQFLTGFRLGFWIGVITVFACLFLLAILKWVTR